MAVVALRPGADRDRSLLLKVYASTREEELSLVAWPPGGRDAFLQMQFDAQARYWREQRPHAAWSVIEVDGVPAGRLYVDRTPAEIRIVDVALLPEFRGRGVGSALLQDLLDEAAVAGVPVTIHVERDNRARTLYERLGFAQIGSAGVYDLLEWRP